LEVGNLRTDYGPIQFLQYSPIINPVGVG